MKSKTLKIKLESTVYDMNEHAEEYVIKIDGETMCLSPYEYIQLLTNPNIEVEK